MCLLCNQYLRFRSQGINDPLDSFGGKKSVFYKVRRALHPWSSLLKGLNVDLMQKNKPFSSGFQGWRALLTLENTEFFDP